MLQAWDKQFPGRLETIFQALQHVAPSQLVDRALFDFAGLAAGATADAETPVLAPGHGASLEHERGVAALG
jgi:hypothetical protein